MCKRERIIAVDFDGCLCENAWPGIGEAKQDVIDALLLRQKSGAKIILWTCRVDEQLSAAVRWCTRHGIVFDAINENLPVNVAAFGNDCRKVYADEYWDDKAVSMPLAHDSFNNIPIQPGTFQSVLDAWNPNSIYGHTPVVPTNRMSVNPRCFVFLRELARLIVNGTEWNKKARIVLEYDPDAPKMEVRTFMERDAALPPSDREWIED